MADHQYDLYLQTLKYFVYIPFLLKDQLSFVGMPMFDIETLTFLRSINNKKIVYIAVKCAYKKRLLDFTATCLDDVLNDTLLTYSQESDKPFVISYQRELAFFFGASVSCGVCMLVVYACKNNNHFSPP